MTTGWPEAQRDGDKASDLGRLAGARGIPSGGSQEVLKRFLTPQRRKRPGEECEMCAAPISEEHSHVVNIASRNLLCTCRGCFLLFTHGGAAQGKYRAVPDRYLYDRAFNLSDAQWHSIQIPVSMAFFFFNSVLEKVVAFYPSPAGATESLLSLETWDDVMEANPAFSALEPDVEALMIVRGEESFECFLVPIDAAYDLVGRVKLHWKGFDGGEEAWREIGSFFAALRQRSKLVTAGEPHE